MNPRYQQGKRTVNILPLSPTFNDCAHLISGILEPMPRRHVFLIFALLAVPVTATLAEIGRAQVIKSGSPACSAIALTFDLCPVSNGRGFDPALVDYLIEHKIPATFFMSGRWIAKHEADAAQILNVGFFEVGTHGEVHAHLPMLTAGDQRKEIIGPVTTLNTRYARDTRLFRPPYGEFDSVTVDAVKSLGLKFIQWTIESGDPDPALSAEQILSNIEKRIKPGSIIVLHANGKGKQSNQVIQRLSSDILSRKGLKPVTVSELLSCNQPSR
jgi:peptidoglycan/xylan/chitin deacetylase (PgdA/CDA1 family)